MARMAATLVVNPARAGMIRFPTLRASYLCRKPRASGDDPVYYREQIEASL